MKASTIFLVLLGLSIAAIGGVFTMLMWKSYLKASAMHDWPQVEAVILSSEVEEWEPNEFSPREYRLKVLYGYEWDGEAKTGERLTSRGNPYSSKRDQAESQKEKYPAGARTKVYVNPDDHDFTILKPDTKAAGYSIWFPMLFVIGGLGIVIRAMAQACSKKSVD
ncbi:DUF3592 domain-containing protein [Luteolibacter algae]|uniref:DUF3592 domain-containing protein n=1 Tax=Luteolibacter algae TaxID=454151 RepID=A0ABW5DA08_9BACT